MSTAPRLTIDLGALVSNWQKLKALSPQAEASAVIKANAYGLGIEPVATALSKAGCKTFFVAMAEEGERVRVVAPDARVFILNGIFSDTIDVILDNNLAPVLSNVDQVALWAKQGNNHPCAIHVDTGMNRLGMDMEETIALSQNPTMLAKLNAQVLMSHLACNDEPEHEHNMHQHANFQECIKCFKGLELSFASSAAILAMPECHYDLTRPGISLYGGEAVTGVPNPVKPVVTAQARILQIRTAKAGSKVGYGAREVLTRDTKIATISAGYADGIHRASSGAGVTLRDAIPEGGKAWLDGYTVPILGRISMDLTTLDVTDVPDNILQQAKWVELFGHNIMVDDAARVCGTMSYELLTSLGGRYHREYLG